MELITLFSLNIQIFIYLNSYGISFICCVGLEWYENQNNAVNLNKSEMLRAQFLNSIRDKVGFILDLFFVYIFMHIVLFFL